MGIIGITMLAIVPSHAESRSVTYVATSGGLGVYYENQPFGIGGQWFRTPTKLLSVKVEDLNGPGVPVTVCQENGSTDPGDRGICGDGGDDQMISFCSTSAAQDVSTENFKPQSLVIVRVDNTTAACPTVAIGGTLTIEW